MQCDADQFCWCELLSGLNCMARVPRCLIIGVYEYVLHGKTHFVVCCARAGWFALVFGSDGVQY